MMTIARTWDAVLVEMLMKHPDVFPFIGHDGAEIPDLSRIFVNKAAIALKVLDDGRFCGMFMLMSHAGIVSLHTMLLSTCRGRKAREAAEALRTWLLEETQIREIHTFYYSNRPHVGMFAKSFGFAEDGHVENVTIKGEPVELRRLALTL